MKIDSSHNVNFGCKNFFHATLRQAGTFKKTPAVDVFISELDFSDAERIEKTALFWNQTQFGFQIIKEFLHDCIHKSCYFGNLTRYFTIEDINAPTMRRVRGLALAEVEGPSMSVALLQSERQIEGINHLSGVASCLMYGITKVAKEKSMDSVWLVATKSAEPFYEKIGFRRSPVDGIESVKSNIYTLEKENYEKFLKSMEKKYSIEPFFES